MISPEVIDFGTGSFVGDVMYDQSFFELPTEEQARVVGWADSCPVVGKLIDDRGAEAMLQRYGEVNLWFTFICRAARGVNPSLSYDLTHEITRKADEPVGEYESESVPQSHIDQISPMGRLAGYALPRVFIEQIGTGQGLGKKEVQDRLVRGLSVLDMVLHESENSIELLASLAEGLTTTADTKPMQALKHMFSEGWMGEHNAHSMIRELKAVMPEKAPILWGYYQALTDQEKINLKLV